MPQGNPYEAHSSDSYFQVHARSEKVGQGHVVAATAEELLRRKGRLIELGCGRGDLLIGAAEKGWSVAGVDMTAGFVAAAGDVPIEVAPLESCRSLERLHDVVALSAILEHVYDPVACLRRVHGALVADGLVYIDVPNECSLWSRLGNLYMRLRGRDWAVNLSPTFSPFHVVGFCPKSLTTVLARTGFDVVRMTVDPWKNEVGHRPGFWGRVEHVGAGAVMRVGYWLNMGAGISCWARKRPA